MIIPHASVSEEALDNLLRDYCLRAWGLNDVEQPVEGRIQQARAALEKGELLLWFSEYEESAYILAAQDLPKPTDTVSSED